MEGLKELLLKIFEEYYFWIIISVFVISGLIYRDYF